MPLLVFCAVALTIWVSCAGSPEPQEAPRQGVVYYWFSIRGEYFPPPGMTFIPEEFPSFIIPPGVGVTTAAVPGGIEREALSGSFRAAYISGLFRGVPLEIGRAHV